jgi:hypothetical protein
MSRTLNMATLAIAVASILAGAVIAVLPAMVLALVHLFYNSAGGVLILLGNLLMLLPHPALPSAPGGSSLPYFQMLQDHLGAVLFRSLSGTILCCAAFAILINDDRQDRRLAAIVTACCGLAALIAGHDVAIVLTPAIAVGLLRLARSVKP